MYGRGYWRRQTQIRNAWSTSRRSKATDIDLQQKFGLQINHKVVLRLMRKLGIRSQARKPKMHKKLEEIGTYHRYPNVLNLDFAATKPNQKWVTNITHIRTVQGWAYLSTIKVLYDGFIVAHVFDQTNSIALVTQTLKRAKQKEKVTNGLVLHSDQRTQYTSQAYHVLVGEYNITPSMSRRGNCQDNTPMENFFGHLKEEYLRQFKQTTFNDTGQLIDEYIYFYNLTCEGFLFLSRSKG